MSLTRIYVVIHGEERRLVEATSAASAIKHCVAPRYIARPATPKDVAQLSRHGIYVETAGEYDQSNIPEIPEQTTMAVEAAN